MKAIIHYRNGLYEDEIELCADSIDELREKAYVECQDKRGWEAEKCWSEVIE